MHFLNSGTNGFGGGRCAWPNGNAYSIWANGMSEPGAFQPRRKPGPRARDPLDRFLEKVEITEGCWLWTANTRWGYGQFYVGGNRKAPAHRWFWEYLYGPIPDGLQIDHLCCTTACVNPGHLEPVTGAENNRRRIQTNARRAREREAAR